jgi:spore germination cell wall hydrolase CwlJ-like protein
MTILQEARSQTLDGMIGVAEVIRDRTKSKFYSNGTVISTVLWPYQFSGWNTKDPNREICGKMEMDNPLVIMAIRAWKIANNNFTSLTGGALFYHARTMNPFPDWASSPEMEKTTQIQDHIFYKRVIPNGPSLI